MALFNVSLSSKFPPKSSLSFAKPPFRKPTCLLLRPVCAPVNEDAIKVSREFVLLFKRSILRQANFKGAKLLGASFFDADLTDFIDVPLRDHQREYLCSIADGVNPTTGNATCDTLLCQ